MMGLINARMSERSFRSWQKRSRMIKAMLGFFDVIFAQSEDDASRLRALGARDPICHGNLKYDASMLTCDENELLALQKAIGSRPVWLAASTHPGEETHVANVHKKLVGKRPDLLTIIVPRHPKRGEAIAMELQKIGNVALRSKKEPITSKTNFYIADTIGELGLFFRLSEIVFMGGSLVQHGGQNPLEPARLSCAIVTGPHTHNFADIYNEMAQNGSCIRISNTGELAMQIQALFEDTAARERVQNTVRVWMKDKGGASDRIIDTLSPALTYTRPK